MRTTSYTALLAVVLGYATPLEAQGGRDAGPTLTLDHLGCVVDDATLNAVAESGFLADQFAHARPGGAANRDGAPWANHMIYGELTYVEVINARAADVLNVQVGDCMIALNSAEPDGIDLLADRVAALHPESSPSVRLREIPNGPDLVPWYYMLSFDYDSGISGLGLWVKETHPDFKHLMAPAQYPEPGDISRQRGAPEVAFHPNKYLQDVIGVTVALPDRRRAQFEELLSLTGFRLEQRAGAVVWVGQDFEIEFVPPAVAGDYAIREIRLNLNRPYEGSERHFEFGSLTLRFTTTTDAVLEFDRPTR